MEINKYQQGKIYKITDIAYTKTYYGSTIQELSLRMINHINQFKTQKNKNLGSFDMFEEFGMENCKIELVELYPCNSRIELEKREGCYIKYNECVNKRIAGRSRKEYYDDNNEMITMKRKERSQKKKRCYYSKKYRMV